MFDVFLLTFNRVGMLLAFIAIGYFLRRHHDLPDNAGHALSLLCTLIFGPAYSIANLSQSISLEVLSEQILLIGYGCLFMVCAFALSFVLSKPFARDRIQRNSLIYAFAIPNFGYFGYPVIENVFGSAVLAEVMVFLIPMTLATHSIGFALFMGEKKISVKEVLLTPMVIALVIGVGIGLSGLRLPAFLMDALSGAGSCMSPCSMLLAGFLLGKFRLGEMVRGWRPYVYSGIRMVAIPLIFGTVLVLLGVKGQYLMLPLLIAGIPLGLNLVVFPESMGYEKQASENAKMCFLSYLMSLAVLPFTFAIIAYLVK